MEDLDIILEGTMFGAEMNILTEARETSKTSKMKAATAVIAYNNEMIKFVNTAVAVLTEIDKKIGDAGVTKAVQAGTTRIKKAGNKLIKSFADSITKAANKYKRKRDLDNNFSKIRSEYETSGVQGALSGTVAEVTTRVVNMANKVVAAREINKKAKAEARTRDTLPATYVKQAEKQAEEILDVVVVDAVEKAAPSPVIYTGGKAGNKSKSAKQYVSQLNTEAKKAEKAEGIVAKAIKAINEKFTSVYNSFKDELSSPSYKGIAVAAVALIAAYGALYGALKGMKIPGLGSIINPVATIKLAVKAAGSPSEIGVGKSMLISAILTIILGALGVTGTMVFNLIKAKFKK